MAVWRPNATNSSARRSNWRKRTGNSATSFAFWQIAEAARPRIELRGTLDRQLAALGNVGELSEADVQRLDELVDAMNERQKQ